MTRLSTFVRIGAVLAGLAACGMPALGQQVRVDISDPAPVKIEDLFAQADLVAVVYILSGDGEHYENVVYKAEVRNALKGTRKGERIYFGPFVGYSVGGQYLAFLRKSREGAHPSERVADAGLHYGNIDILYRVMYQGYSIMPIEYVCVFAGKEIRDQCDYGVKVNTYQVRLPKSLSTFPLESDDEPNTEKKWVRSNIFTSVLQLLKTSQ